MAPVAISPNFLAPIGSIRLPRPQPLKPKRRTTSEATARTSRLEPEVKKMSLVTWVPVFLFHIPPNQKAAIVPFRNPKHLPLSGLGNKSPLGGFASSFSPSLQTKRKVGAKEPRLTLILREIPTPNLTRRKRPGEVSEHGAWEKSTPRLWIIIVLWCG